MLKDWKAWPLGMGGDHSCTHKQQAWYHQEIGWHSGDLLVWCTCGEGFWIHGAPMAQSNWQSSKESPQSMRSNQANHHASSKIWQMSLLQSWHVTKILVNICQFICTVKCHVTAACHTMAHRCQKKTWLCFVYKHRPALSRLSAQMSVEFPPPEIVK